MVQSPWEANWFAASQIPSISRNPKVHYRTHKGPPTVSILGQPNPVHIPTSHILEIHPIIIHPSTPRPPQWSLSLRFPHQDPIHLPSPHPYAPHAQPISFISILSPAQYWVSSTNHLVPRYAVSSIPPLPHHSKVQILSSTPCSQTPSASFPPTMSATKFHAHTKQKVKLYYYYCNNIKSVLIYISSCFSTCPGTYINFGPHSPTVSMPRQQLFITFKNVSIKQLA